MERRVNIFNLNLKKLNLSAWIVLLISYVAPYRVEETGRKLFGYPFAFIKFNAWNDSRVPLMSSSFDLFMFVIDILVIYLLVSGLKKIFRNESTD